jgi:2-polyprenyl-3-methyl-5-hydroxy-6-metoxy-1,4-benzoquinol methylase
LENGNSYIIGRGKNFCRGCNGRELFSALDLGDLPIANELWPNENQPIELFPLHLRICRACGLGQVEDVVTPSRLFRDYRYLSSTSTSFLEHARSFAEVTSKEIDFKPGDWVLEIASNDGYLLQHFIKLGIDVLGIEPAENVAQIAKLAGVPTVSEFFSLELAENLLSTRGTPKLIVANNVMAHVPDIQNFVAGIAALVGPETRVSIENPSLINFLKEDQFDTIYHEHYSYLTANSVDKITNEVGLQLFKVEEIVTHGGSNRYWLRQKPRTSTVEQDVVVKMIQEIEDGLFNELAWGHFNLRIKELISSFYNWVKNSFETGEIVCGYGAPAKASTLINASRIEKNWIKVIADASPEKQGRFMPSHGIPIVSPKELFAIKPTDVIIFPWNITKELSEIINSQLLAPTRIWKAIPKLELVN